MKFPIVLCAVALILIFLAWAGRRRKGVAITCVNVAAVVLGLAGVEVYLSVVTNEDDGTRMEGSIYEDFYQPNDLLGYAAAKNATAHARKLHGDTVVYDVVYTTNQNGLRVTAPPTSLVKECVVFFGDSSTFGEGIGDSENFPYLVSKNLADVFATYNFGFSGYGPHQMLATLQSGRVDKVVECHPKYFFYYCIPEHVARVTGLAKWDKHGPRYKLLPNGSVIQQGHFDDPAVGLRGWIDWILDDSLIWQRLYGRLRKPTPEDLSLLVAVMAESARIVAARYHGAQFEVIMWDGVDNDEVRYIANGLMAAGVRVLRMSTIVKDYRDNEMAYVIGEYDLHPNPKLHRLIAEYLSDELRK